MSRIVNFLFIIIILGGLLYSGYVTTVYIAEEEYGVVYHLKSSHVTRYLGPGWHIIPDAILPGSYDIRKYQKNGKRTIGIDLPIPPFEQAKEDIFTLKFTLDIHFSINEQKLDTAIYASGSDFIKDKIVFFVNSLCTQQLKEALKGPYRPALFSAEWEQKEKATFTRIKKSLEEYGINISHIARIGALQYPDSEAYLAAVKHRNEMVRMEREYEIEMKQFNNELEKKQLVDARYKMRLEEISGLIKKNPLILKYIYIDKMADNIKMILPINTSGYPLNLDESGTNYSTSEKTSEEIDNLR